MNGLYSVPRGGKQDKFYRGKRIEYANQRVAEGGSFYSGEVTANK
jgi:hypothetical protein